MQAWIGWTATSAPAGITAPTWDEWCARQRCIPHRERHQHGPRQESSPFSERELERLSFVRWLFQSGRLDPAQNDNS
jgi:hypothetical protein